MGKEGWVENVFDPSENALKNTSIDDDPEYVDIREGNDI